MRFLIHGTGGVGGYFGGKLAQAGKDVWFVARGGHLEAMRKNGLLIKASEETFEIAPGKMTDSPAEAGVVDVVLFCVKSYDTDTAAEQLAPILHHNSVIISLQNGIDNEERIRSVIPRGKVYGGVAYIYSTITAPGEITEYGGPKKIVFGPMDHSVDAHSRNIVEEMVGAGIKAELSNNIQPILWEKFVFITGAAGITALTRLMLGDILSNDHSRRLLHDAMAETDAVARALGIELAPHLVDSFFPTLSRFKNETRSSLYYDLANGKPMEIEALAGTVVRLGKQLGIHTPIQQTIYASLLPHHLMHVRNRELQVE